MGAYTGKIFEYKCNGIFAVEQFLPAVGNTTWPWVYMEHKLGGDK
jgi:hypothetical protein